MSQLLSEHNAAPQNPYGYRDPRSVPGNLKGIDILIASHNRELQRPRYQRWLRDTRTWLIYALANASRELRDLVWRLTLGRWFWIKCTHGTDTIEVETMRMVAAHTNIPVPRVWAHFLWHDTRYIIMSRARGVALSTVWTESTPQFKEDITNQLAGYFRELRALRSPFGPRICSISGGPVRDFRLRYNLTGPFEDENDFNHRGARFGWDVEKLPAQGMPEAIAIAHSIRHHIVFTHGDLARRNIMVDGSRVTALLDWECAGWFPAHWEYCKSIFATSDDPHWLPWLRRILPAYDVEAEADEMLVHELFTPLM